MKKKILFFFFFSFFVTHVFAINSFDIHIYKTKKYFKLGCSYYHKADYQLAIYYFQKSLVNYSKYNLSRIWLGKAYYQAGYFDNAVDEWSSALELGEGNNILRQKLNFLQFSLGVKQKMNVVRDYDYFSSYYGTKLEKGKFVRPISLFASLDNSLFVVGFSSKNVLKLNLNGDLLGKIALPFWGIKKPFGFVNDNLGNYYISDFGKDVIYKFDSSFKKKIQFGGSGITNGRFAGPEGMAIGPNNSIWIADNGNNRVQKFDAMGNFLMSFGKKGHGPSDLYRPSGIAYYNNFLYVSDYGNKRIQKFDLDGNYQETIGANVLTSPRGLDIKDDLLIVANGRDGLFYYDLKNKTWWQKTYWNGGEFSFKNAVDVFYNNVNNLLYVADFDRNAVDVFMPASFKYSDLFVDINRIYLQQYPLVALRVSVRTRDGKPVYGLTAKNFHVREDTVDVPQISLAKFFDKRNSIVFLVDKSFPMQNFQKELANAADFILKKLEKSDRVKVLNVNSKVWTGNKYDYSRLRTLEALKENKFSDDFQIDQAIYQTVSDLNHVYNKKAIVIFTAAQFDAKYAFSKYEFDVVSHYAANNNVPVFIVAFSDENHTLLRSLAKSTGGAYFNYYSDSGSLKDIYSKINNRVASQYLLIYETGGIKGVKNWRPVHVSVNYQKLAGVDESGYFKP